MDLVDSDVFNYTFDFDQWPSNHANFERALKPYHGSLFELRDEYSTIFTESKFQTKKTSQSMEEIAAQMGTAVESMMMDPT